jgi:hypothetical protein
LTVLQNPDLKAITGISCSDVLTARNTTLPRPPLEPDAGEIGTFLSALFRYASDGSYISLRCFDQAGRNGAPVLIQGVPIASAGIDAAVVAAAVDVARRAANADRPMVFAPPICTFDNANRARTANLVDGIVLSVDLDTIEPGPARSRLEGLLGPCTAVVASGGMWVDDEGVVHDKLHLHWRLSEPTANPEQHERLRHAQLLAAELVGGDTSAASLVHPLRIPGSWHRKDTPRLCRILSIEEKAEIHLEQAIEALEVATEEAGREVAREASGSSGSPEASVELLASAMAAVPNNDVEWGEWIRVGMALYRATGGRQEGLTIWHTWSAKSAKHDAAACDDRWVHFKKSPPDRISAGSIFFWAKAAGWQWPKVFASTRQPDGSEASGTPANDNADDPVAALVAEFNASYFVVNEAGKAIIYAPYYDPALKRRSFYRFTFEDFKKLHSNRFVQVGIDKNGNPIMRPAAEVWLKHPQRKQYLGGVTFNPASTEPVPGVFNLWNGLHVAPSPGDWSLMRSHIEDIICDGDPERFNYLMGWKARMLQRPAERGEVAVVMKGVEGCGKGTLANALLHLFGQHGMQISNSKHLVGNFNQHLRDCVFLFADEAFFAGDKANVGVLKSLITEPYLTIEGKYMNAVQSPNFLHVMMASNEEWVVPASKDARRFFVLEVSERVKGNYGYFDKLRAQMETGGYEAMLHDLLAMDLTHFNVRAVPVTDALQEQKVRSLDTIHKWWLRVLERGSSTKAGSGCPPTSTIGRSGWRPHSYTKATKALPGGSGNGT